MNEMNEDIVHTDNILEFKKLHDCRDCSLDRAPLSVKLPPLTVQIRNYTQAHT